jgi:8-amino-7-oxononanoate synthase
MLIKNKLEKRQASGYLRELKIKKNLIDFASNDYLGLAKSKKLKQQIINEWEANNLTFEIGSSGSRLLTGNNEYIEQLEKNIAAFHGFEAGLIFNCGYMANIGLISALQNTNSIFFYDLQIHASMHDGFRLGKVKALPFKHNDLNHLEKQLKKTTCSSNKFICIESVYSTDGAIAPLFEIWQLSQKYHAKLIVDEAHAVGIFGPLGKGLVAKSGLAGKIFAQVVTFGKALGTFGAIVLGDKMLKSFLINFARSCIYTTALPIYCLVAIKCSYKLLPFLENERSHLNKLIQSSNYSKSQIQPIKIISAKIAIEKINQIANKGFDIRAFLKPTVQKKNEIIRLCLHSFNSINDLKTLLKLINDNE